MVDTAQLHVLYYRAMLPLRQACMCCMHGVKGSHTHEETIIYYMQLSSSLAPPTNLMYCGMHSKTYKWHSCMHAYTSHYASNVIK